jgi:hypothetical protein
LTQCYQIPERHRRRGHRVTGRSRQR